MRVLHVITGLGSGGAELQLAGLVERTRHEAEVASLSGLGSAADRVLAAGVAVHDMGMRDNRDLAVLARLARLVRRGRFDVVHVHLYRACVYGRLAARLARVARVVTTEHSIGETQIERRPATWSVRQLYLATARLSDVTVAVSEAVARRLRRWGLPSRKLTVIPNGVDFERLAPSVSDRAGIRREIGAGPDEHVVGSVARLDPVKRHDLLLRACAPLVRDGVRLVLVGDGPERPRIAALAAELGLGSRLTLLGERSDAHRILPALDTHVSASLEETFGVSTVEALSAGVPSVATTCPALEGQHVAGFRLVGGDEGSLRGAIGERIAADGPVGVDVEALRRRFDLAKVAADVDRLYEQLAPVASDATRPRGVAGGRRLTPGSGSGAGPRRP